MTAKTRKRQKLISKNQKMTLLIGMGVVILALACAIVYMRGGPGAVQWEAPSGGPLERMELTEKTLAVLSKAIDMYYEEFKVYPSQRQFGAVMDPRNNSGKLLGGELPSDGWSHFFYYVPNTEYKKPASGAFAANGKYFNPDKYQLYSAGADLDPGHYTAAQQKDNINIWDESKPWRLVYEELNKTYSAADVYTQKLMEQQAEHTKKMLEIYGP